MQFGLFLFLAAAQKTSGGLLEHFLWWAVPLAVVGFCALLTVIIKFVKTVHAARIARLPLAPSSELEFSAVGKMTLWLEAPALTILAGSGLQYELLDRSDGRKIELHATAAQLFGANSGSTIKFPVRVFQIEKAGKHLLNVSGFKPRIDYSRYFLIVRRARGLQTFLYILALILTGSMFIGGFVFTMIGLTAK